MVNVLLASVSLTFRPVLLNVSVVRPSIYDLMLSKTDFASSVTPSVMVGQVATT